jgi:hypothetical protein
MSFRTLVESEDYARQKALIEPDVRRLDEVLGSTTFKLCQRPSDRRRLVRGTARLYVIPTDPFPGAPALLIAYTFDEHEVTLLWIELAGSNEDAEE